MPEPWVRFEDDRVLAVAKPAGVDAERRGPQGQDGVADWVRRLRGEPLALLRPVPRETDGTLVLGKAPDARRDGIAALDEAVLAASDRPSTPGDHADPRAAARRALEARTALFDPEDTDALLWIDREADGFPATRVERLGDVGLALRYQDEDAPIPTAWLDAWMEVGGLRAVYEQRRPRGGGGGPARLVAGAADPRFEVRELGVRYVIDLGASATSSGLFLDQRETRRALRAPDLAGATVLNTFAHTGSLSVAAALAGATTLTLDLSRHYLDWAQENLRANGLDPADHDAVYGDALDWLGRFARKGRTFDLVLVDPPSSSTAKGSGRWVVDRDLHALVERAARVVREDGTLYVSTNLRRMTWPAFLDHVNRGLAAAGRHGTVETQTVPLDHRTAPDEPPYLKAAWIRLAG